MQTSAAIATAAVAQERTPVQTLKVDWDADGTYNQAIDDLTSRVESITIQRQLATDLPDEVSRVAGYSAADLTVTLSGDPTTEADNAGSYFSPFNTASALYGKRRRWRTCQAQIGFGSTTLPVFTGKTTGLQVDSATRTATLTAVDNAETMRGTVDLPVIVASRVTTTGPYNLATVGLNSSWVVDYIARACGFYASPPLRTNCSFHATLAGSLACDVGKVSSTASTSTTPTFVTGKFVQGFTGVFPTWNFGASAPNLNNGGELLIEGWVNPPSGAQGLAWINGGGANPIGVSLDITAGGILTASVRRTVGGTVNTISSGLSVTGSQWNYVAVHVHCTSSTVTIHFRVGGSSATGSFATSSVTGQPALVYVSLAQSQTNLGQTCSYEAWQVSNPGTTTSAPTWNDSFTATSTIQASLNNLTATVPSTISAWEMIQQIAAAEMATTGFDESGNFFYYNRTRWTSAPWTTSQRTINANDSLTAIATAETIDQLRNHVRITATPAAVNVAGWVWNLADAVKVPASSSTTITADMGVPIYNLSTSVRYASTSGLSGQSQYRANRNRDGSGAAVSNLTVTVAVAAGQLATITITNPNAFDAYMVSGSGFTDPQGTPSLALWGQQVLFAQSAQPDMSTAGVTVPAQVIADVSDSTSISQHGDQLLDLSGNPWLQDGSSITTLASDLLARLKDPLPMLDGLTIIGDPRLQLGDRVTIVEPTLGLNSDFFLTGITSTFDASGYTQALTVRAIS